MFQVALGAQASHSKWSPSTDEDCPRSSDSGPEPGCNAGSHSAPDTTLLERGASKPWPAKCEVKVALFRPLSLSGRGGFDLVDVDTRSADLSPHAKINHLRLCDRVPLVVHGVICTISNGLILVRLLDCVDALLFFIRFVAVFRWM